MRRVWWFSVGGVREKERKYNTVKIGPSIFGFPFFVPTRCNWNCRGSGSSTLFNSKICSKNRFPLFLSRETDMCWKHSGLVSVSARLLSISPFFVAPFFSILSRVWMGNRCAWGELSAIEMFSTSSPCFQEDTRHPSSNICDNKFPGKKIPDFFSVLFLRHFLWEGGKERYKWLLDSPCTLSPKVGK